MLSAPTAKVTPQGVHQWLSEFGWDVDSRRAKYPTKYKFNKNTKEQFKLIVREYSRMEEEKDSRQFGSVLDSLARLSAGSRVEPRWAEVMKLVTSVLMLPREPVRTAVGLPPRPSGGSPPEDGQKGTGPWLSLVAVRVGSGPTRSGSRWPSR